jgi:8-oxo-dGTP diphosphatase/2-hydroxy-dATP diphosphatase
MVKRLTLCVLHTDTRILLGMKKRGFGVGRWNGFGGKVGLGETVEDAARRELREECGIEAEVLERRGTLRFEFAASTEILDVHLFGVAKWRGEPVETEEMRPCWFRLTEIPFDRMWPDDRYWLPRFLEGKRLEGTFYFLDHDTLLHHSLHERSPEHAV